jgi:hypothetical protein
MAPEAKEVSIRKDRIAFWEAVFVLFIGIAIFLVGFKLGVENGIETGHQECTERWSSQMPRWSGYKVKKTDNTIAGAEALTPIRKVKKNANRK